MPMNRMNACRSGARHWAMGSVLVALAVLAGCVNSPTYGTGKRADQQLLEDVTGILDLSPTRNERIEYKPRAPLVTPAEAAALPAPQENAVAASGAWPESPEEMRARYRAEATANRDNPGYRPRIRGPQVADGRSAAMADRGNAHAPSIMVDDAGSRQRASQREPVPVSQAQFDRNAGAVNPQLDPNAQREEFNRRLAASRQGSPTTRNYLSEPPVSYRSPAETAPADDIGVDEEKKERQRRAASRKKSGNSGWRDLVPWL